MDVRQFDFLAAQPSAELKPRDTFCGISKRALALLLVNALFWQPIWAQAEGIVVSNGNGARLDQAGNGVPIVNIATPGANGLSHNQFQDYNVDSRGVILNNVTDRTGNTQLGGIIVGNPNLQGRAAGVILNEVVGGSPSQLRGYTEVAGQAARVIVANPYGVTCNGCGFINTPRVTLTTGKPILDGNRLDRFQVDGGSVTIEGNGLNADNVDQFDIVTRSAKINAELHARQLNIVAGRNDVAADSLAATPRAASPGDAPQLAIDSSALGGMYANTIRLVGTEAGVGVKLAGNLAASAGDIQLDANGQLTLAQAAASGNIALKSQGLDAQGPVYAGGGVNMQSGGDLTVRQSVAARNAITLNATGQLTNAGVIEAGINPDNSRNATGDVSLQGAQLTNRGSVIASRSLSVTTAGTLDNRGGNLVSQGDFQARVTGNLDNRQQGNLYGAGATVLSFNQLLNAKGVLTSGAALTLTGKQVNNDSGQLGSQGNLTATLGSLDQLDGQFISQGQLTLIADRLGNTGNGLVGGKNGLELRVSEIDNRGGEISSQSGSVSLTGESMLNSGGKVIADSVLTANVATLDNSGSGVLSARQWLRVTGVSLANDNGGLVTSGGDVQATLTGSLTNTHGQILAEGTANVTATSLDNSRGVVSSAGQQTLTVTGGAVQNDGGQLVTDGGLSLSSASLDNGAGTLSAKGAVSLTTTGVLSNAQNGRLIGSDTVTVTAGSLTNTGRLASAKDLQVSTANLTNSGALFSQAGLTLDLQNGTLTNASGGLITAPGALLLNNLGTVRNAGELSSGQAFTLAATSLDNSGGKLVSNASLTLRIARALANAKGTLSAAGLDLQAASLANAGGTLVSRGALSVTTTGLLDNSADGLFSAATTLDVTANSLTNSGGSLLAKGAATVTTGQLDNTAKGLINSQAKLTLTADHLDSSNGGEVSAKGDLQLTLGELKQQGGRLIGEGALTLDLGRSGGTGNLDNIGGLITTTGVLSFAHLNQVINTSGEISSAQSFELIAQALDNSKGKLISQGLLKVQAGQLTNEGGLLSGWQGLTVSGGNLSNRQSGTLSSKTGDLAVSLSGTLDNGDNGALATQGALTVTAANLNNTGGVLSSGGAQTLTVTGTLQNGAQGLIDAKGTLTVNAGQYANGGTTQAQQALSVSADNLDNSGGTLSGQAAVTLDLLGALTNSGGAVLAQGDLLLKRATQVANRKGRLNSGGLLTLLVGGLDNSNGGTLAGQSGLRLTASGQVSNGGDGLLASQGGALSVTASALDNNGGTLQSATGLTVATGSGTVGNAGGKLLAQNGDLSITAGSLDNRGGILASLQGAFTAGISGLLANGGQGQAGGTVQAQRLDLSAGTLSNYNGKLSALGGDALIQAGSVDNRNGSLYGKGLVRVRGGSFDNSGDNDGQVFGNQIDFSLSGALNNRLGIIESNSTLNLAAASLDNINGKLRALGSGGTTLLSLGGTLDNTNGRLESANQNLQLNLGGLTNANGTLLHVGTGTFGLGLPLLQNAGGSVTSNGTLTLSGSSWTNSSTLQVANLVVNVDNLTQIGSGQLIASNSFNGNGGNWTNDGLISAGGNFSLALGGTYQGAGRLSSGYDFTLNAGQLLLDNPNARLTAGSGTTTFNLGGLLRNQARITSAGNFTLNAGQVDNRGTLGASGNLTINTLSLTNQNSSLIFSGGDMAFGVNDFTNRYADVYSLGRLLVARDSSATQRASRFENISATMESAGDMTLRVDELINRKDILNYNEQFLSGDIAYECLNCKGRHYDLYYYVTQKLKRVISADSRSASLLSGGSLQANSNNFSNRYSVISASRDIDIRTGDFENTGAADSVVERFLQYRNPNDSESKDVFYSLIGEGGAVNEYNKYMAERKHRYLETVRLGGRDGGTETRFLNRNEQVLNESNPDYSPSRQVALPGIFSTYTQVDSRETVTSTGASAMAVVQAGGSVRIEASQNLSNGLVQQGIGAQRGGNRTQNTQVPGVAVQTTVTFNSQLPPDLAQQQVNPTTLPGFSLPTGQNGLFRLSGQQNSAADIKTGSHAQWLAKSQVAVGDQVSTQAATYISGRTENISKTLVSTESTSIVSVVLPTTVGHYLPHRYLVETNPALTDLKQFMSSDYLLGNLNYNPDTSWKRLGDGLYEQRLVQQAIVARTGQRFIAGLNSDEAQFKYLMDNAIASKQALGLSVGVSLTAAQVAALTHDIVWMEDQVINGEHVLVPVLYLAHANNRLAPNGALIQGSDVTLIAGNDLNNAGTLRATNNLTATANNDLVNSGLIQSGDRLSLTSTLGDITNRAGGIISGRDVSLTASRGDILNERTVTTHTASYAGQSLREDYADSAAHIEAGNNLSLIAGRDINNVGSVLSAGGNATLIAGRDVNLISAQTQTGRSSGANNTSSSITQLTGSLTAGRDLGIGAGRNLTAVATTLSAGRNASLAAQENLTLAAAADETHSYSKSKKVTRQEDHVSQQITTLTAGGNVSLMANQGDLTLVASKVAAGGEAYLYAGKDLNLLAAQDSDYSLYDMKKKGSFGAKKTKRDEVTDVRNIGSEIKAGGDITLQSEGNQTYQAAKLQSGKDLTIDSGGDVTFAAVKDLHQESHEKSGSSAVWQSAKGKGNTDETLQQSQLVAQGQLAINAVQGLKIDVKEVNGQTVSQTIDAMVKADPNLAWIKQAEERGDVDWRQVKEIHDSFKYSQSGLGGAAAMVIAIVVAYFTAGLASGMVATMAGAGGATAGAATGAVAGAATAAGTTAATGTSIWAAATATTAAGWANAAASAALTSMASSGAVNLINNRGNIGATLKDTLSSDGMKNAMIAAATAALTVGVYDKWTGTSTATNTAGTATGNTGVLANSGAVSTAGSLSTWSGVGHFAANQALQNGTSTLLNRALGRGGSLGDALQTTLANTFAAVGFNFVGDISQHRFEDGSLAKIGLHAVMGGLAAEAAGGDFKTGALAAGVNEALVASLAKQYANMPEDKKKSLLVMNSQLIGVFAAAAQGSNEKGLQTGAWVAANGTQYNFLSHQSQTLRDELRKKVEEGATPQEAEKLIALEHADQQSDYLLEKYRQDPNSMTAIEQQDLERYLRNFSYDQLREYGFAKASKDVNSLLKEGNSFKDYEFPYAAGREARDQAIVAERSKIDSALGQLSWLRDKTENEEIFNSAQKSVRIQNALQGEANLGQPALYFLPGGFGMAFRAAEAINGANQLGHGIDQAITGDAWNAAGNIVMGALGTAGMAGSVGSARGVISTGAKEIPAGLSDVWKLSPTQRGVEIESYLAKADYSSQNGWYNVGAERNGYFPLVDFQNGNTLVSLKSVDTSGSTWLARMQNHIIDLGTNGAKVNDMPANMVLDLRVQPGGSAAAKSLIEFGREYNVKVIIKEFE